MLERNLCPRCGNAGTVSRNTEAYEDGIHEEQWCDRCGWYETNLVDPDTKKVIRSEHNDGFGVAAIAGEAGAVSEFFDEPLTAEEAVSRLNVLKKQYDGAITHSSLTIWDGEKLVSL